MNLRAAMRVGEGDVSGGRYDPTIVNRGTSNHYLYVQAPCLVLHVSIKDTEEEEEGRPGV